MLVDLVQTTARDGVRLDGALQSPPSSASPALPVDAFCLVHGTGGNFYGAPLFDDFAARLLQLGCKVLRANTRGHDLMSTAATPRGGRRLGAAYEVVDDCRHDVAAWVAWLRQNAGPRVGLLGHSLGAVKALYALAHEPDPSVACVIGVSPPRLSYSWFCSGDQRELFLATYAEAERLAREGRPEALMDVKFPLPFVVTAAGYLDKYGPDERYNVLNFVGGVRCPALVTLGSVEVENNVAFRGLPEALAPLCERYPRLRAEVVAGGDHFYTGARAEVVARVEEWLRGVVPA